MANIEIDGEKKKTRVTDYHKKNKPITWIRMDESSGNKCKHRDTIFKNTKHPRRSRHHGPEKKP